MSPAPCCASPRPPASGRRTGAGDKGPRLGEALRRPFPATASAPGWAFPPASSTTRRGSPSRRWAFAFRSGCEGRRPAAAQGVRTALASTPDAAPRKCRPRTPSRNLRPALVPCRRPSDLSDGNRPAGPQRLAAPKNALGIPLPHPSWRNTGCAQSQSMFRSRNPARAASLRDEAHLVRHRVLMK